MQGDEQVIKLESESETRNVLLVNYRGKCFLCLQNYEKLVEEEFETGDGSRVGNHVSLLSIARYLKINTAQAIRPDDLAAFSSAETSNVFVTLCDECCRVVNRLSSLCLELEALQMKVNHQLRSFHGVLERSERAQGQGILNSESLTVAEILLRDKFLIECLRKLDGGLVPKLILGGTPTTSTTSAKSAPPKNGKPSTGSGEQKMCPRIRKCPVCHPKMRGTKSQKRNCLIYHHPDTLLTSYKLEHVTPAEFKEYCDHALKQEVLRCRKNQDANGVATSECPHCAKGLTCSSLAHYHLLSAHEKLVGERVKELQRSSSLEEIRNAKLPSEKFHRVRVDRSGAEAKMKRPKVVKRRPVSRSKLHHAIWVEEESSRALPWKLRPVRCTICRPQTQMKWSGLKRHQMRLHLDSFFWSHKRSKVSVSDFKLYCQRAFQEAQLASTKIYHPVGRPSWECGLCSKSASAVESLRHHFILEHREHLESRIAGLQQSVPVKELRTPAPVQKRKRSRVAKVRGSSVGQAIPDRKAEAPEANPPTGDSQVKCNACGPHQQMKDDALIHHQIGCHLETFFESFKAPHVSAADMQLYCQRAFKEQLGRSLKVYDITGNWSRKCHICSKRAADERTLSHHFLLEHKEYMGEKIRELQASVRDIQSELKKSRGIVQDRETTMGQAIPELVVGCKEEMELPEEETEIGGDAEMIDPYDLINQIY